MAEDETGLSQADVDNLLRAETSDAPPQGGGIDDLGQLMGETAPAGVATDQSGMGLDQASLDALVGSLDQEKQQAQPDAQAPTDDNPEMADLAALSIPDSGFGAGNRAAPAPKTGSAEFIHDVTLRFTVELGQTRMLIRDVLKLKEGSVVLLNKEEGEVVDILINDRIFAHGKLKIIGEFFAVEIVEIVDPLDRYRM